MTLSKSGIPEYRRYRTPTPTGTASAACTCRELRTVTTASAKDSVPYGDVAPEYSPRLQAGDSKSGVARGHHPTGSTRHAATDAVENGWLGDLGQLQFFFGTLKAELRQFVAERFVGLFEGSTRNFVVVEEFFPHSNGLGTLAGKEKSDGGS